MSNKNQPRNSNPSNAAGGGSAGSGPSPETPATAATPPADVGAHLDPKKRAEIAKLAKVEPKEVIGFREYSDRIVVVVQVGKTVDKREIAL